ncbi:TIP41 protein-like [Tropilaelaps mercedesae]|uniref:TIP41-like protein n=1 Tax=Tropilaelaps mercedesae TaxID=418985 RepID=A0A1V9X2B0_9ACAR|nr:TIP41 protein-like [Tropilaelaps mercedesae]
MLDVLWCLPSGSVFTLRYLRRIVLIQERGRYVFTLQLPSHPDMTFAWNRLRIEHQLGFGIEFDALDALKLVTEKNYIPKVAVADAWQEARHTPDLPVPTVPESHKFDWTFTTNYKGTLLSDKNGRKLQEVPTTERIDMSKLTSRDPIHFYQDLCLYEDELSDHGVAKLSVKIRVMSNNLFVLLRFFLRVDQVLIRMNDTRLYWEQGQKYLLREYAEREHKDAKNLNVPTSVLTDPIRLSEHLPLVNAYFERLDFPQ